MKLFGGGTSPYVRKCRVTALELGMANRVEFAAIAGASEELKAINPIVKIPVLELDNGEHLFDSRMTERQDQQRPRRIGRRGRRAVAAGRSLHRRRLRARLSGFPLRRLGLARRPPGHRQMV